MTSVLESVAMFTEKFNMKLTVSRKKRTVLISLVIALLVLSFSLAHTAYAGKSKLSLNSPASFPVDI